MTESTTKTYKIQVISKRYYILNVAERVELTFADTSNLLFSIDMSMESPKNLGVSVAAR